MADARETRAKLQAHAAQIHGRAVPLVLKATRDNAPVGETGDTRRLTTSRSRGPLSAEIVCPTPQGEWVNDGTPPHVIRPRRAGGVLRFTIPGKGVIFARRVSHPGTKATHWFDKGVQTWSRALKQAAANS